VKYLIVSKIVSNPSSFHTHHHSYLNSNELDKCAKIYLRNCWLCEYTVDLNSCSDNDSLKISLYYPVQQVALHVIITIEFREMYRASELRVYCRLETGCVNLFLFVSSRELVSFHVQY
jgi:hypothetical protein